MKNEEGKKQKKISTDQERQRKSASTSKTSRIASSGEIQYGHTIGRHGTDDEKNLNPEE